MAQDKGNALVRPEGSEPIPGAKACDRHDQTIAELDERNRAKAEAVFKNQKDEIVVEASLTGILPGFPEKRIMEVMMAEGEPPKSTG